MSVSLKRTTIQTIEKANNIHYCVTTLIFAALVVISRLIIKHRTAIKDFLIQMFEPQVVNHTNIDSHTISLINQINGMATIWLETGTYADRLILKIPTFNYCKCISLIGDSLKPGLSNKIANYCFCGKNNLNLILSNKSTSALSAKILSDECTICLETYKLNDLSLCQLACYHNFHKNCIYEWFLTGQYTCPVCRREAA